MKRKSFISTVMILAATPLLSYTQNRSYFPTNGKGFKIKAGEGRIHEDIKLKGVNKKLFLNDNTDVGTFRGKNKYICSW